MDVTDKDLVTKAQMGEKRAFDSLVLKYQDKVASLVSNYVSNKAEALDVTQDSFIKAYKALDSFRGDSKFYTWLYRIAINTAKNHLVAKKRRPPDVDIDLQDVVDISDTPLSSSGFYNPELSFHLDETEELLANAIEELPTLLKTSILLREVDGLSYEEIAEKMGCPVGTVRSRLYRGREIVASKLGKLKV